MTRARPKFDNLPDQAHAQVVQIRVRESRLKGGNQHLSLFQNGDFHVALPPNPLARFRQRHHFVP